MKKTVFHKFENEIYPISIYVSITNNQTSIQDNFLQADKTYIEDLPEYADALCMPVIVKESNEEAVLIIFRKKEWTTISTIAHESFHCAEYICQRLGIKYSNEDNSEAFAYLLGYIVDCCEQVRTNKFKC